MDVKRSYNCCFRGRNLHPRVIILCTLSPISFFLHIIFLHFLKLKRIIISTLLLAKGKQLSNTCEMFVASLTWRFVLARGSDCQHKEFVNRTFGMMLNEFAYEF